jgi:hypothetical protein
MNIKDLVNWRKNCFHCGEELSIVPSMANLFVKFDVKDNLFYADNSFLGFAVHIETGEIVIDDSMRGGPVDVNMLLNNRALEIKFKCEFCSPEECYYDYSVHYRADQEHTHMESGDLVETLYCRDKYYIFQYKDINQASISSWRKLAGKTFFGAKPKDIANIIVPYLDLFKLTPEKLESKIKTFILFS